MTKTWIGVVAAVFGLTGCMQPRSQLQTSRLITVRYHWDDPAKETWSLELRGATIQVDDLGEPIATFDLRRIEENARGGRLMPDLTMAISLLIQFRDGDAPTEVLGNFMRLLETLNESGHRYRISLKTDALEQGVPLRTSVVPRGEGPAVRLDGLGATWDDERVTQDEILARLDQRPDGRAIAVQVSTGFLRRPDGFPFLHRILDKLNRWETTGIPLHLYALTILKD